MTSVKICLCRAVGALLTKTCIEETLPVAYQGGRVVKALDLSSNVRMHTWVRTPFLVEWDPGDAGFFISFFFLLFDNTSSIRFLLLLSEFCCFFTFGFQGSEVVSIGTGKTTHAHVSHNSCYSLAPACVR